MSNVLIFRYGQLGDTLVALPALWALRENFPLSKLVLLSERPRSWHIPPQRILPAEGLIDEYLTFETSQSGRGVGDFLRLGMDIRRLRFDVLAYLAPRLRDTPWPVRRDLIFFRAVCGIERVVGHTGVGRIELPEPGQPLPGVMGEAESLLVRLAASGIAVPEFGRARMDLGLTALERERAENYWRNAGVGGVSRGTAVAMGVGGKWASKLWPEKHFAELGQRLIHELNLFPVVFGGPEDLELGRRLVNHWGRGLVMAGALDVREAAGLMEGMAFYVGNDSGTMHLAAAAKLRCVAIFSSQDWPGRWAPYGEGHISLRHRVVCEGCRRQVCNRSLECLDLISVEEVFRACELVDRNGAG